jgi:hypothetical protein
MVSAALESMALGPRRTRHVGRGALGPDGRLYFTDSSDNTVYVVTVGNLTML